MDRDENGDIGIEGWMVYYDFILLCWQNVMTIVGLFPFWRNVVIYFLYHNILRYYGRCMYIAAIKKEGRVVADPASYVGQFSCVTKGHGRARHPGQDS